MKAHPMISIPRSVVNASLTKMTLHNFSDASKLAVSVAIYIVVSSHNTTPIKQNLLVAKSRIAPKNLSIPRLELVAAHTFMSHGMQVLKDQPVDEFNEAVQKVI